MLQQAGRFQSEQLRVPRTGADQINLSHHFDSPGRRSCAK